MGIQGHALSPFCETEAQSTRQLLLERAVLSLGLWAGVLTISLTQTVAGHHCSEPASRGHTSTAAGSSATSPGPKEGHMCPESLWL